MGDVSRYHLLLRYEALIDKLDLKSISSYEKSILGALEQVISDYVMSEDLTELQRRKLITKSITDKLGTAYSELSENLLEEMDAISLHAGEFLASTFIATPAMKANKFNAKRLIHGYELGDMLKSNTNDHIKQFKRIIANAVTEGKHSKTVLREMKKLNNKRLSHVSQTLVQSAIAKAREQSKDDMFRELEKDGIIEGYEFVATLEINTCPICAGLDGKKWKKLDDIPSSQKPKIHFRCRCILAPTSDRNAGRAGQQYYTTKEGAKKAGSSFPNINYYEWLELQPKAVQKAVKSKKRITLKELSKLLSE